MECAADAGKTPSPEQSTAQVVSAAALTSASARERDSQHGALNSSRGGNRNDDSPEYRKSISWLATRLTADAPNGTSKRDHNDDTQTTNTTRTSRSAYSQNHISFSHVTRTYPPEDLLSSHHILAFKPQTPDREVRQSAGAATKDCYGPLVR